MFAVTAQFRLMSVHAHPDDESSKGAATVARYSSEGVEATLLCCTGGEEGDIVNDDVDTEYNRNNLAEVRVAELKEACSILGYRNIEWLGYRDSGMKGTEPNNHPESFWQAPLEEAAKKIAKLIRKYRPHVILSYGDPMGGYDHPDHVKVWHVTDPACELAADPNADIEGEAWQVLKRYDSMWSIKAVMGMHERFQALGLESPFHPSWFERLGNDELINASIECSEWFDKRQKALLAHRTQIDPNSPFWFGLPHDEMAKLHTHEHYRREWSKVESALPEDDLFAGIEN